jgi:hypothetical protein
MALTWRKDNWQDKTYHATTGNLSYTVDHNGRQWRVRGWVGGTFSLYRDGSTMKAMKQAAADHAAANG